MHEQARTAVDPDASRPQFPIFYLIFPLLVAAAFAVPGGDALLGAIGAEPTRGARFLALALLGLAIASVICLLLVGVRRMGKH
jgi:hypothetical protein